MFQLIPSRNNVSVGPEKGHSRNDALLRCRWENRRSPARGRNEDRWPDIASAARIVQALSESAALGSSLLSVVGRVVLAAVP
jgi:hypothetical protein